MKKTILFLLVMFVPTIVLVSGNILASVTMYETENLTVAGSSGDLHRVFGMGSGPDANLSGGYGTILEANAVNDYVTYTVSVPQAGSCNVRVGVEKEREPRYFPTVREW